MPGYPLNNLSMITPKDKVMPGLKRLSSQTAAPARVRSQLAVGKIQGFTLIEVLVSMVIVAVGILGIAALQYRGVQFTYDAYLRSQASIALFDLADKIRAAPETARGAFTITHTASAVTISCAITAGNAITDADHVKCWRENFNKQFPAGTKVTITRGLVAGSTTVFTYTATITATDKEGGERKVSYTFTI